MKRIFTVLILIIGVSHLKAQAVLSNNDMKVSTQTTILKTIFKPNITFPQIMPNVTAMAYSDLSMKSSIKPFKPFSLHSLAKVNTNSFDKSVSNNIPVVKNTFSAFQSLTSIAVLEGVDHMSIIKTEGYDKMSVDLGK
jgi:hypothetical protein